MSADLELEDIEGVPNGLPEGEKVVWQGRPRWSALARHGFGIGWFGVYLASLVVFRLIESAGDPRSALGLRDVGAMVGMGALLLAIIVGFAVLYSRSTTYTITSRRILLRTGVALPMTWNLPFKQIASADLRTLDSRHADIVLSLVAPNRIGWLHLWPHVDSWNPFRRARPTLRALPEASRVAGVLAQAVRVWAVEASREVKVPLAAVAQRGGHDDMPAAALATEAH
ncbi:MAG: PH domain-containing protein [Myxococcales bacterium]|nr:PH domain-containing protein [Myxococcales bacterium]